MRRRVHNKPHHVHNISIRYIRDLFLLTIEVQVEVGSMIEIITSGQVAYHLFYVWLGGQQIVEELVAGFGAYFGGA